jgi:dynein heavy chain
LDRFKGKKELFKENKQGLMQSLSTVLLQEMQRFNTLLSKMKTTLKMLKQAIRGFIVMSEDLDAMYVSLSIDQVPANWKKVSYLSLKPLSSWYKDLKDRVAFMADWIENGHPSLFCISYFFFPQGFMTGTLQTHARNYQIAIDQLQFSF